MKKIIVTGGTRGIGQAICKKLLASGFSVIATGRNISATCPQYQHNNLVYKDLELISERSVSEFCDFISEIDGLYGIVNNAGINIIQPYAEISTKDFNEVLTVNLKSVFELSQSVVKKLQTDSKPGKLVHIGSIWSVISKSGRASYSASKAALHGMTRAMSAELASQEILVNMISPGFVKTELTEKSLTKEEMEQLTSQIPIKRMAMPIEIAEVVEFLISDRNTYLTGQNIVVDGGFSHV